MSITFLGLPNVARRGSTQIIKITGAFVPTALEGDNLKTGELSQTARLLSVNPLTSQWEINTYSDPFEFGGFALVSHNLSQNGYFRIVGASGNLTVKQEYVSLDPTSIASSTNLSSTTISNIVGTIGSPNATYIGPSNTAIAWNMLLDFNQDVKVARQGTAMACVVVEAKKFGTPNIAAYPTIKAELYEGGVLKRNLGLKAVSSTNQIFVFPFNPAELASPSVLANVQVKISGYPGNTFPDEYWMADTVKIYYDNAGISNLLDSGWVPVTEAFWSDKDGVLPSKSRHYLTTTPVTGIDSMKLMYLDDGTELNPPTAGLFGVAYQNTAWIPAMTTFPDGYIEAAMAIFGPALTVTPGIERGSSPGESVANFSAGGVSQVGQSFGADSYSKREFPGALEILCTRDMKMELLAKIGWQKGLHGVFYVIIDSDLDPMYQMFSSFPCTCKSIQASPIGVGRSPGTARGSDLYLVRMELEEKL